MVQKLKHIIEINKFPIFLLSIPDCRNETLGNNIHSSQDHRSFCRSRPEGLLSVVPVRCFTVFAAGSLHSG